MRGKQFREETPGVRGRTSHGKVNKSSCHCSLAPLVFLASQKSIRFWESLFGAQDSWRGGAESKDGKVG